MSAFVNQTKEVNRVALHLIVNVVGEWFRPATGKAMRANMVATAPANDLSRLPRDAFVKSASQTLGNFTILVRLAR